MRIHLLIFFSVTLILNETAFSASGDLAEFNWLAGCWQRGEGNNHTTEQWMKPVGDIMIGMSRTVQDGNTREYEFIRIVKESNEVFYIAIPSRQKETSFKLVQKKPDEFTFENPAHDFPQRVRYRYNTDGSLLAQIEGTIEGKTRTVDFPMKRVSCDEAHK